MIALHLSRVLKKLFESFTWRENVTQTNAEFTNRDESSFITFVFCLHTFRMGTNQTSYASIITRAKFLIHFQYFISKMSPR